MEYPQKLKISQCVAFGLLFQFIGWLLKGLEADEDAIILGGKITFILSYILLLWGGMLYAQAEGILTRQGTWRTVGLVLLALGVWTGVMALVMKLGEALYLHNRFTGFVVLIIAEGRLLTWLHAGRNLNAETDIQAAGAAESGGSASKPSTTV